MEKNILNKLRSISCKNKAIEFISKNRDAIIAEKIASVKKTSSLNLSNNNFNVKVIKNKNNKYSIKEGEGIVEFIANTYLWMDNHNDVHDKGCFKKTIKERKNNIFHLLDHSFKLSSKIGKILDIEEKSVSWSDLNIEKDGETICLVVTSKIRKSYNEAIYDDYMNKDINQHSVGMWYVKIFLAVNNKEDKEGYKTYLKYIDLIGNKSKAEKSGWFFVVKEAGLREVSAVLEGSNELTGTTNITRAEESKNKKSKNKKSKKIKSIENWLNK